MFQSGNISISSYHIKAIQDKEAYKNIIGVKVAKEEEKEKEPKNENSLWIDIVKGIKKGIYDEGKDFVTGITDLVTNPIETVEGFYYAASHPDETVKYITKAIVDSYVRDMVNGDAYSRSRWVTYAISTIATSVVGPSSAATITKTGITITKQVVKK